MSSDFWWTTSCQRRRDRTIAAHPATASSRTAARRRSTKTLPPPPRRRQRSSAPTRNRRTARCCGVSGTHRRLEQSVERTEGGQLSVPTTTSRPGGARSAQRRSSKPDRVPPTAAAIERTACEEPAEREPLQDCCSLYTMR